MKVLSLLIALFALAGCGGTMPVSGAIYADVQGPVGATSNPRGSLKGEACATSYLGMVALGDASITAAAKAGGINTISYVEHHSTNILGIINKYCTQVIGHKGVSKSAQAKGMTAPAAAAPAADPEM